MRWTPTNAVSQLLPKRLLWTDDALVVIGVMDLRVMTVVTAANTLERLAPDGERMARIIGVAAVVAGLFLIMRAGGFLLLHELYS